MGKWTVNYTIQDKEGHKSVASLYFPDATSLADVTTAATAGAGYITPLILGGIVAVNVSKQITVAGVPQAVGDSDVEDGGLFTFQSENGFYTRIRLPTFDRATNIPANSDDITVAGNVSSFTDWMVNGDQPGAEPCDYRGDDITALSTAKEAFQKQRK